jgi:hypothetical protein
MSYGTWQASAAEAHDAASDPPPPPLQPGKEGAGKALRRLYVYMEGRLTSKAMQLLNIGAEWLRTYLPHTLQKIDRVSFGLLSQVRRTCMFSSNLLSTQPVSSRSQHHLVVSHRVFCSVLFCSQEEYKRLAVTEPHMPRSRVKLAIPFLGKDVPSNASEFAHPDVIIGLTILAYRYEGLRRGPRLTIDPWS